MVKTADAPEVMDVSELKQLLHLSKRQQINCAIGMTRDKQGVVLLHRRTKPRKLLAELLRKQSPALQLDRATLRFGHANVAGGSDSTTVHFTVNKGSPDTLRVKMLEKLRTAGYQHCDINVDAGIEDEAEDEDEGKPAGTGTGGVRAERERPRGRHRLRPMVRRRPMGRRLPRPTRRPRRAAARRNPARMPLVARPLLRLPPRPRRRRNPASRMRRR